MKLFPVRTQALRLPALVLVCLLLVLGAVLGFAICRAVPQQDRQELSDYLHQYAQATADGRGPSASALSVAAAYFRYPLAAALLGLTAAGLVLLPVLSVAQGFFLSFSVGCFARALGRGGVYLALAAFGPRCLFVLPCTLLLTVQGLSAAARRRDGQKVRLTEGAYWRRVGLCGLILLIGAALELTFGPRLLQWVIARTLEKERRRRVCPTISPCTALIWSRRSTPPPTPSAPTSGT